MRDKRKGEETRGDIMRQEERKQEDGRGVKCRDEKRKLNVKKTENCEK